MKLAAALLVAARGNGTEIIKMSVAPHEMNDQSYPGLRC
jgi:hypothetical protein